MKVRNIYICKKRGENRGLGSRALSPPKAALRPSEAAFWVVQRALKGGLLWAE